VAIKDDTMSETMQELMNLNRETAATLREITEHLKEESNRHAAYEAAVRCMLTQQPNLEAITKDFMTQMDRFASPLEHNRPTGPHWHTILHVMTAELNRRGGAGLG
jgi:DNA repair exonuclease SbcCD ATPase subunit